MYLESNVMQVTKLTNDLYCLQIMVKSRGIVIVGFLLTNYITEAGVLLE